MIPDECKADFVTCCELAGLTPAIAADPHMPQVTIFSMTFLAAPGTHGVSGTFAVDEAEVALNGPAGVKRLVRSRFTQTIREMWSRLYRIAEVK